MAAPTNRYHNQRFPQLPLVPPRKEVCDTNIVNETGSIEAMKLNVRVRKTLRGHLSKVCKLILFPFCT